jgi:hypothetical protein
MNAVNQSPNRVNSSTAKRKSALAQLVALYATQGTTSTTELVALTGYSKRAIDTAKRELKGQPAAHQKDRRKGQPAALRGQPVAQKGSPLPGRGQPAARPSCEVVPLKKRKVSPTPPLKKKNTPLLTLATETDSTVGVYFDGPFNQTALEKNKKLTLGERAAVLADDRSMSDEERFETVCQLLATDGGLPMTKLQRVVKITEDFWDALMILKRVASANSPERYLHKTLDGMARAAKASEGAREPRDDEPSFIRQARHEGYDVERSGEHWLLNGKPYDRHGDEVWT